MYPFFLNCLENAYLSLSAGVGVGREHCRPVTNLVCFILRRAGHGIKESAYPRASSKTSGMTHCERLLESNVGFVAD